jgi:hypothetical protein
VVVITKATDTAVVYVGIVDRRCINVTSGIKE